MTGGLDREAIAEHLGALEQAVSVLRTSGNWTADELRGDTGRLWIVAHGLQLAIQNVVDIAAQIAGAIRVEGAPETYHAAILALGEMGVTDGAFATRIAPMAGLRNILVHGYLRLDVDRLVEALQHLDDFATFAAAVQAFLARNPGL